jgi:DNA-binding transcriptional LysR family regulator
MAYSLPPLNAVRQFEAAARHLSFRLAADELLVTPSAVSHGVQALEKWLGVPLFVRERQGLVLTPAGAAYLPKVREALDVLASATAAIPKEWGSRLTISVAPGFATRWLLPNLHRFRKAHPDIDIAIDTVRDRVEFPRDGVDLAIRMGDGGWPDLFSERLLVERIVPVCAPTLADTIRTPEDLSSHTLLHVTGATVDWGAWARMTGATALNVERGLRFDTLDLAWSAAAQGMGVAIGRLPLVNPELSDGRLVAVLGEPMRVRTGYWLTTTHPVLSRADVAAFRGWLKAELHDPAGLFSEA